MKPSDKKRKMILNYLNDAPFSNKGMISLIKSCKQHGYSELEVYEAIQLMDYKHMGLLQAELNQEHNGTYYLVRNAKSGWLSPKGEDYRDDLNHAWKRNLWLKIQIYAWPIVVAVVAQVIVHLFIK
ncbi:hypothetical protein LEBR102806_11630 [Levilactobacillus brevis]|uniref:hypothetical protein n=1 Tax=Levilactobacillus brevis TaxID=1580 RepID=UPI000557A5F3|nr:hypothetical protein [Levilactobacillus brevis]MCT3573074.1 hypothetical protein [Levilactobacillus brevis]SQG81345.1 Uncharacterised protein [Levilactobacillus brevis]